MPQRAVQNRRTRVYDSALDRRPSRFSTTKYSRAVTCSMVAALNFCTFRIGTPPPLPELVFSVYASTTQLSTHNHSANPLHLPISQLKPPETARFWQRILLIEVYKF